MTEIASTDWTIANREDLLRAMVDITTLARIDLCVFAHELTALPYDDAAWLASVKDFALRGQRQRVRICARRRGEDTHRAQQLKTLSQRLVSRLEVRLAGPSDRDEFDSFILADLSAVIWLPRHAVYRGSYRRKTPQRCQEFRARFDTMWDKALPHPEFQRLAI